MGPEKLGTKRMDPGQKGPGQIGPRPNWSQQMGIGQMSSSTNGSWHKWVPDK